MAIPTEPTLSTRIRMISRASGHSAAKVSAYLSGTKIELSDELKTTLQEARRHLAKEIDARLSLPPEAAQPLHKYKRKQPVLDETERAELTEKRDRALREAERPIGAFDYGARKWNVEYAELVTPAGAPDWAKDRQTLWNRVEAKERGPKAQVAREFRCNLSYDLTADQRREVAHDLAVRFADMGMCVDVAVHRYGQRFNLSNPKTAAQIAKWESWGVDFVSPAEAEKLNTEHVRVTRDQKGKPVSWSLFQPHLHALTTTRPIAADGKDFESKTTQREALGKGPDGKYRYRVIGESKARQWNDQTLYEPLRKEIAERQNAMLKANGSPRRIDHRRYEERRAEALAEATKAQSAGKAQEAARQTVRAAQLRRDPEPYLGASLRLKNLTSTMRHRFSQWVVVKHHHRLESQIDALWDRDHVSFVVQAHRLLENTRRSLGLEPEPTLQPAAIGPADRELEL